MKRAGMCILPTVLIYFLMIFSVAAAQEIRYDKGQRRDPFVPPINRFQETEGSRSDALSVEGIVYDPKGGSYAVVGGEIYREGESVDGTKVLKILADCVIFLQENEEVVIWLRQEMVSLDKK